MTASPTTGSGRGCLLPILGVALSGLFGILVIAALLGGGAQQAAQEACGADAVESTNGPPGGPLGGVHSSGLSSQDWAAVSARNSGTFTSGRFLATAYGPPWGGIQGAGIATAGGVRLNGGAPHLYMIAVDPAVISLGQLVYAWPNPFRYSGPFVATDTGSAINGRHIDFYDWRGRRTQTAWGSKDVEVDQHPITAAPEFVAGPPSEPSADTCATPLPLGSGNGADIARIARTYLGKDGRQKNFAGFTPASFPLAWCSWFATNVWRRAGISIPMYPYSADPYERWALPNHPDLIWKKAGEPPKGNVPPQGTLLMYRYPNGQGSAHINIVEAVNPDGTVQIIGGNQGGGRVTHYGPCRFSGDARSWRHSCDSRTVYAAVEPPRSSVDDFSANAKEGLPG